MVAQKIKIYSFNLLLQKQIAHVSQDVADPNLLYLQYGWSAFDIGLVQDIGESFVTSMFTFARNDCRDCVARSSL